MNKIDYEEGINCPEGCSDDEMLINHVIADDHELNYLDAYMRETFRPKKTDGI